MSYGVVRVQKFTASSVKGIEIHDNREKDHSNTNPDIDFERSGENFRLGGRVDRNWYLFEKAVKLATQRYDWTPDTLNETGATMNPNEMLSVDDYSRLYDEIRPDESITFRGAAQERIDELNLTRAVRKDAVVMAQVLVTSDFDFFIDKSRQDHERFFKDCFNFLCDRYGRENVISATVHMDERTPHMHFNFVPVTADGRLCAKDVLTKACLIEQQDAFFQNVGRHYGLLRGEPKESGKRRNHLETAEYKSAMKEIAGLQREKTDLEREKVELADGVSVMRQEAAEVRQNVSDALDEMDTLVKQKGALRGEISDLKARLLTEKEVADLKGQKTITGALKGVSFEDYKALQRTARRVNKVDAERDKATKRAEAAEKRAAEAEARAKKAQEEKPSMLLQMENARLSGRLERMEMRLKKLLELIPEQFKAFIRAILGDRDPFTPERDRGRDRD